MNKLLTLGISFVIVICVYLLNTQSGHDISSKEDYQDDAYSIGKRFPATAKVEHDTYGVTHQKKLPDGFIAPKDVYKILDQNREAERSEAALDETSGVLVSPANQEINKATETRSKLKSASRDRVVPQQIQDFVQGKTPGATSSSSLKSSGITSTVFPWAAKPAVKPSDSLPTEYNTSNSRPAAPIVYRVKGKVIPLQNVITKSNPNWLDKTLNAYAAPTCLNPKIGIYRTSDLLKLGAAPLQELQLTVGADFNFPTLDSSIDISKPQNYSLQVSGCDVYFSRILTDFIEDQNINLVSTFISFSQVSPVNVGPMDVSSAAFKSLVHRLEVSSSSLNSYEDIYNELNSSGLAPVFNNLFQGSDPDSLKSALPIINSVAVPNIFNEEESQNLTAQATHWSSDYTVGVQWFVNGVAKGFGPTWSWAPHANSSANVVIKVLIGKKKDLLDEIDTTLPYHQLTFNRAVVNTIQPQPPTLALVSTVPLVSSTPHLNLELSTGAVLPDGTYNDCRTFSSLAITETATSPDPSGFNIICSSENTQALTYSLSTGNRTDGAKDLYLWSKDDLGNISSVPSVLHIYLDQSAPVMSFNSLASSYGGGQTATLSWELSDHTVANTQHFDLEYFDGTLWTTLPDVSLMNGPLTSQLFSTIFTFPDADLVSTKFRVTATDLLGHTSSVESNVFNIQRAILTSTPTSYSFGDIGAGLTSPPTTITFTNTSAWSTGSCAAPALTGDTAQFTILSQNCSGSSLAASGTCQISVQANPTLRQAYTADITLACGSSSVISSVMVTGENNLPTLAGTATQNLNEDVAHNFTLTAGVDADGDPLTYLIVSGPSNGTLLNCLGGTSDLTCSYTPDLNFNGNDSFSYRAYDGQNYSPTQTVSLVIAPVNDAPTLGSTQSVSASEESLVSFDLNAGADIENNTLSYIVVSSPANGTLSCTGGISRSCTYTGNTDFVGNDSFQYKVNDGFLDSSLATVTITVSNVNDAPVSAADFSVAVNEDEVKSFTIAAGTDIDLPAQTLTYSLVSAPAHGTLSGCIEAAPSTDRNCDYTPDADYVGNDSFSYRVCDPDICSSNVTTVSLVISPVNDAPVMIANQSYTLDDTQFVDFNLNGATDIDVPADTLSYRLTASVSQGTLTGCIDASGWNTSLSCRYTPPANFNGTVSFTYKAYDGALESSGTSTVTFTINDKTPSPVPTITLASAALTNLTNAQVTNTSCTDIDSLYVSINSGDPAATDSGWASCSTTAGYLTTTLSSFNGIQRVFVWSKDSFGNVSTSSYVEVVFDNIAPAIAFTNSHNVRGNANAPVGFRVSELHATNTEPYYFRYHDGASWSDWTIAGISGTLSNQMFTTSISAPNLDNALVRVEVRTKDAVGNEGTADAQFYTDLSIPYVDSLSLNGGSLNAGNNNLTVALNAHDDISNVQYFCLKYNDSATPGDSDACWRDVSAPSPGIPATTNITFNNYFFQVGFTKATYQVYAWVKDQAGLISVNTGTIGVDKYDIFYDPGTPPRIDAIQVSNSDAPAIPITSGDMSAASGSPIYIKWNADDTEGFSATPMSVEYTVNDIDFLPLSGGVNLLNEINGSCTIDARFTGCVTLSAPSSAYFKIRLIAKDDADSTVYLNSSPLNDSKLRILAGNTESGLGGSAISALFYNHGSNKNVSYTMKNVLVVSEDGKVFYIDPVRGLLWIDPSNGVLKTFINITGHSSGDGGLVKDATLWSPQGIALDAYNHLLIWDWGRIRRVNLSTMIINTIVGGGGIADPSSTINANALSLAGMDRVWGTFTPMPNGDIIFHSPANTLNPRRYRAADQKIVTMTLQGQGFESYPSEVWSSYMPTDLGVAYNTTTSEINFMVQGFYRSFTGDAYPLFATIDHTSGSEGVPYQGMGPHNAGFAYHNVTTGLDGHIYAIDRFRGGLFKYDHVNNARIPVVGNGGGASIPCPDGTLATSCPVDMDGYFVSKTGRIYFLDNGLIRTVDDNHKVLTLFGQFPSYGNGHLATTARFGRIVDFKLGKHSAANDKVIVMDGFSSEFREFTIDSTIQKVADASFSWHGPWRFEADPATGDIMTSFGGNLHRLNRLTNAWNLIVGGGGYAYYDASSVGRTGLEIANISGYDTYTAGFSNNKIYHMKHHWVGYDTGCVMSAYDSTNSYVREHFMGHGACSGSKTLGANFSNQYFGVNNVTRIIDPNDGVEKTFFVEMGSSNIYNLSPTGELELFADIQRGTHSFAKKTDGSGLNLFYCSSGQLWKYNYASNSNTHLSWPSTTLSCVDGRTIEYNAERNSIIFSFTQNSLYGIAEYKL